MSGLPNSYVQTPNKVKDYLHALLNAEAPERFSQDFLVKLGFKSTNDRLWIGVLKDLGFLDLDGKPTRRYFAFLDRTQWKKVLAEGIRDAFSDLFSVNTKAHTLKRDEVKNKLRTLYQGDKSDNAISLIASTFEALVKEANFSQEDAELDEIVRNTDAEVLEAPINNTQDVANLRHIKLDSLVYQISIVLPATRDQSVYDAIFRSLREHLG